MLTASILMTWQKTGCCCVLSPAAGHQIYSSINDRMMQIRAQFFIIVAGSLQFI